MKIARCSYDLHSLYTVSSAPVFHTAEELEKRREELRFSLRMAAGLYPWPERTPLNVRYQLVGEYDGYSVQKVMFESFPGLWSTGNLYLPKPLLRPAPAILNVIGHWEEQRLHRSEEADYPQQIANFARMGFVCLVTDMIGKVDSRQLSHQYGSAKEDERWLTNGLGVQLWNNIRALDLLCSMPEVDSRRIGVTGASGGGSQSLFLALADDRIRAAAPINMMSLHFEGGCQCENAPGLRRETVNMEMCAVLAPRPVFLAGSTGDWTCSLLTAELPVMKKAYALFGAEDRVEYFYQVADHQYNALTRHRVYSFFAKYLQEREIVWNEQKIALDDPNVLTWFRGEEKAPGFADDEEFSAFRRSERLERIGGLSCGDKKNMLRWMTGIRDKYVRRSIVPFNGEDRDMLLGNAAGEGVVDDGCGMHLPYLFVKPEGWDKRRICLALSGKGALSPEGPVIKALLEKGIAVFTGRLYAKKRDGAGIQYFSCYNYTADCLRAQEIALLWQAMTQTVGEEGECILFAKGKAAPAAACALPLLKGAASAALESAALDRECDIPGIPLLGGVRGILELSGADVKFF